MSVALFLQPLRHLALKFNLLLQLCRCRQLPHGCARTRTPCANLAVFQLRLVARDGPVEVERLDFPVGVHDELGYHA